MSERISFETVPVNFGKLLENQLKKWEGGGHHARGIAEYISNSDDSYRRLKFYNNQEIVIEIHTRSSKKIDRLIIKDYAEGMLYEDLENKFFQYFESFSGRDKGEKVTGRFGTGGKAYAIMNFRHCWIISSKDNNQCKAWFKWDYENKQIIKGYNNGGYLNEHTNEKNGTIVILESSINVKYPIRDIIVQLEKLARIRHVLISQKVFFNIFYKGRSETIKLNYNTPDPKIAIKTWIFPISENLKNQNEYDNNLVLRFFEKPIGENAFIDLKDGISSVADLYISDYDSRQSSKYINGELTIELLLDSVAVKENRRGLEEGDDLTDEIKRFISENVEKVIDEIEELQRQRDKELRINSANEKLKELSKFLSKQDLKFKLELKELKKRFSYNEDLSSLDEDDQSDDKEQNESQIYRKVLPEDPPELIEKGTWIIKTEEGSLYNELSNANNEFIPHPDGEDFAIPIGKRKQIPSTEIKKKQGLQVLYSNDPSNPESPTFKEFDDPVSDRDLVSKGIIWINAVHPIIVKFGDEKSNDLIRNENIANFVLMIIAQYYAQKEAELQPEDDTDNLLLFRKHFFRLQMEIRLDKEISYFD